MAIEVVDLFIEHCDFPLSLPEGIVDDCRLHQKFILHPLTKLGIFKLQSRILFQVSFRG